jgi:drug/metabolite transporter (DMT)-like permease
MIYALLLLMVFAWSFNFIVAKYALREFPPFALLFLRVIVSNALLLLLYLGSGHHRRRPLQRGDWRWFALLGLFGIAMNQVGFTVGINYTTVAHSSLIITTTPLYVLVLATRMKLEAFTKLKLLGMLLSFTGVVVLTLEDGLGASSPTFLGDIITLGGAVAFALYTVYGKHVAGRYDTLTLTTFIYVAGAVVVMPLAGWQLFEVSWPQVTWQGWMGVFYMAAVASVAAYMIFYYALTKIPATRVISFTYLQPVLATILAILLLGERVTQNLLIGGTLVLLGVILATRTGRLYDFLGGFALEETTVIELDLRGRR